MQSSLELNGKFPLASVFGKTKGSHLKLQIRYPKLVSR